MLVLSRKTQEWIVLDIPPSTEHRRVRVVLAEIRGRDNARIGFEAPKEIIVRREELLDASTD